MSAAAVAGLPGRSAISRSSTPAGRALLDRDAGVVEPGDRSSAPGVDLIEGWGGARTVVGPAGQNLGQLVEGCCSLEYRRHHLLVCDLGSPFAASLQIAGERCESPVAPAHHVEYGTGPYRVGLGEPDQG